MIIHRTPIIGPQNWTDKIKFDDFCLMQFVFRRTVRTCYTKNFLVKRLTLHNSRWLVRRNYLQNTIFSFQLSVISFQIRLIIVPNNYESSDYKLTTMNFAKFVLRIF